MVHLQPQSQWRRHLDRVSAIGIVLLGLVVLVAAVVALRQPNGHRAAATTSTTTKPTTTKPSATAARTSAASPVTTPSATSASTAPTLAAPGRSATSTATTATLKVIPLIVLNNTNTAGLAQRAAQTFTGGGWTVTNYSSYQNDIASTCAYYDPADPKNQQAAEALQAQFPQIQRVKARFAGLPAGPVVVVLTGGYS
jgi:hypothetical protein